MLRVFRAAVALLCAATPLVSGQIPIGNLEEIGRIANLVRDSNYAEALKLISLALERARFMRDGEDPLPYWAYLARIWIETGNLGRAEDTLRAAENRLQRGWDNHWAAVIARERAALLLSRGDYEPARQASLRAAELSEQNRFNSSRTAYCRALAALASFQSGDRRSAEHLMKMAVKAVPTKRKGEVFYAPRILFAACQIEADGGDLSKAEAYCVRGLQIAEGAGRKTRDFALGRLALARAYFAAGKLRDSREAATSSAEVTVGLFGKRHPDSISALELLARIDFKEGNLEVARLRAEEAITLAAAVLGEAAPATTLLRRALAPIQVQTTR